MFYCKTCKKEHHAYQNNGRGIFVVSPGTLQDLEDILVTPTTQHMDLISLGDTQVETMHHVISAELRIYPIPVDVIIVAPGMQDLRDGMSVDAIVAKLKRLKADITAWNPLNTVSFVRCTSRLECHILTTVGMIRNIGSRYNWHR